jgi:hypothetical protein
MTVFQGMRQSRLSWRRAAIAIITVVIGAMASLYIPAVRAAHEMRTPRVPEVFIPLGLGLPVAFKPWTMDGFLTAA